MDSKANQRCTEGQASYPKRESFFAHRVTRLLYKSCCILDIGPNAALLVIAIAHTEDAARYSGPVRYWNEQLMNMLGFNSRRQLNDARNKAIQYGWLHYERNSNRVVGRYWVTIPENAKGLDDSLVEPIDAICTSGAIENGREPNVYVAPEVHQLTQEAYEKCHKKRTPSIPNPSPVPKREPAGAGAPAELLTIIDSWNSLGSAIVKPGNGARRQPVSKAILTNWKKVQRDAELRETWSEPDKVFAAVRRATFCHGEGWFTLPKLLAGRNKDHEFIVAKVLNGAYEEKVGRRNTREDGAVEDQEALEQLIRESP